MPLRPRCRCVRTGGHCCPGTEDGRRYPFWLVPGREGAPRPGAELELEPSAVVPYTVVVTTHHCLYALCTCQVPCRAGVCISHFNLAAFLGGGVPVRQPGRRGAEMVGPVSSRALAFVQFRGTGVHLRLSRTHEVPFPCITWLRGIFFSPPHSLSFPSV